MKTKLSNITIKDIVMFVLLLGNLYQWYVIGRLDKKIKQCAEVQEHFILGINEVVKRKKLLDNKIYETQKIEDSIAIVIDSLDSEISILNNRLYRLNKHNEKKYHTYDTATVSQLRAYFSSELFKN